ncbi:GGDEF domain-containing phosphodiesterase [Psychrobium sp. 1_MG-2023]|uniref:GGDEF domain-containing phosphodiesterase n=1 Tax=Psychrobium sp. 1_MG-2023 TaxID=3062624 RepID=UPI000C320EFB|nr:GGDEF domain-containing phosphodiesterase [Psychrobium sp. 1_MG-2023]MDP2561018.1 EAL domain-containing protein [Psychrobium sp. 1_MG-2023]PKF58311.1 hypothetical protein CW748_03895 [Alteromonadales bacterium alter-6D02]
MKINLRHETQGTKENTLTILSKLLELSELVIDSQQLICHASTHFTAVASDNHSSLVDLSLSEVLTTADYQQLLDNAAEYQGSGFSMEVTFPHGPIPNKEYELTVEHLVMDDSQWVIVKRCCVKDNDYFNGSAVAQFVVEPKSLRILKANQVAEKVTGIELERLSFMSFSDLLNMPLQEIEHQLGLVSELEYRDIDVNFIGAAGENLAMTLKATRRGSPEYFHFELLDVVVLSEHESTQQNFSSIVNNLISINPNAALLIDNFGVITQINQYMCDVIETNRLEAVGRRASDILPQSLASIISAMEESEHRVRLGKSGSFKSIIKQQPLRDHEDSVVGLLVEVISCNDRTTLKERALQSATQMGNYAVFTFDNDGQILYANEAFEHQTGYCSHDIVGHNISILNSKTNDQQLEKLMWQAIKRKEMWRGILKHTKQSKMNYWCDLTINPLIDEYGDLECFVALSQDITLQKETQKSGTFMANYDVATGLANDVLARDRLERMIGRARRRKNIVAAIALDIGKIEQLEKKYGAAKASSALMIYCTRLQKALRAEDGVARMSKSRLAILLPDLPSTDALEVVSAKVDKVNQQPIEIGELRLVLDVKQGMAYFPEQGLDAESLLNNAEASLQKAWQANAPIACFGKEQNAQALMHFQLRKELVTLLASKDFEVVYQPIINLVTNEVHSFEAHIHWQHPQFGLINNDEVYTVAEASGCVQEMGFILIERVCQDLQAWQAQGHDGFCVAINLSHGQLRDYKFASKVEKVLGRYQMPPERLSLEIPLSYIAAQWLDLESILQELSLLGVNLLYDKFGDRGAYISDLRHFPFNGIKLTQNYIQMINSDPNSANLVEGIVAMALSLNLEVTAVGVNNLNQMLQLQDMGCHYAQGELLTEYLKRDDVEVFLLQQTGLQQEEWE